MKSLGIGACVGTVLAVLAGCQDRVTDAWSRTVPPEVLAKAGLHYYWRAELPLQRDQGEQVVRLWRLDENVYALTNRNRLIALNAVNGRLRWFYTVAKPSQKVFAPCHADHVLIPKGPAGGIRALLNPPEVSSLKPFDGVIINTLGYALLIDRKTGRLSRKLHFNFAANSPGSSDGTLFYVGSVKGWYHAVRLSDGLVQWTMSTGDMISARPVVFNRRLYVASQDHRFYAINPELQSNRRLWAQTTDGPITADFVVDNRGCFVPSQDYKLYAYDLLTGVPLWVFRTEGPLRAPVQVGQRSCFQYAENDRFYAIDIGSGRKRWELADGRVVLAAVPPHVFVLTDRRRLRMVHEALGKTELILPMTGFDLFVPNATKDLIIAGTRDGQVACIRPLDASKLTEPMLKD